MNFEQWLESHMDVMQISGTGRCVLKISELHEYMQDAWNAAIDSAIEYNGLDISNLKVNE